MSTSTPTSGAPRRWAVVAVGYALVALLVGYLAATGLNDTLAISYSDKALPTEPVMPVAGSSLMASAPVALSSIAMPEGYAEDPLLAEAVDRLSRAVADRTGSRPAVSSDGRADFVVAEDPAVLAEGYQLSAGGVSASDRNGLADGIFAAARAVRAGRDLPDVSAGAIVADLEYRYVDMGAVGVRPDPAAWSAQDDYSHNSGAFADVILAEPPYIDPAGMALARADWEQYVEHIRAYGYNGIVVDGFLEYVNFESVGRGTDVYPADSPYRARHDAMVEQFGAMWQYAADMGMDVVFRTDMLALTGPLEDYLDRELGGIDVDDPRLWAVYRAGIDEFLTKMPFVSGLMIRIGEAGTIYNLEGWDYYSALEVTSVAAVRTMLEEFTAAAAEHDRTLFFRTWSVGVGEVGNMHTSTQTYDAVLAGIDADNLVVVTKYTMGDFYSWLPENPTLRHGDQARVVEFQARREFEAFSSIPNHLTSHQQEALQGFAADNSNIQGIWVWTQYGGPVRAGPMSLYLKSGFWQLYDADVYATGRLGWDLDSDVASDTRDWIASNFSDDPATVSALMQVFSQSREVVRDGLYVAPYAREQVLALGLEPPPMLWIFEWDMVSGDSAALSAVHHVSRDSLDEAVARGREAIAGAERMLAMARATDPATWRDPVLRDRLVHSLEYEVDLFTTLGAFREAFLSYYSWLDGGDLADWQRWTDARTEYDVAVRNHLATYTGDLDTPAFSFFAVDAGFAHAERTRSAQVVTALVMLAIVLLVLLGGRPGRRWHATAIGTAATGLWLGATRPWRLVLDPASPRSAVARVLAWAIPAVLLVASRGAFSNWLSWTFLLVTLGSMAGYLVVIRILLRRVDAFALYAAVGGALLAKTLLLSAVTVVRGPLGYWYRMWTDETWRTVYATISVAAFLWLFLTTYVVLRTSYGRTRARALGLVLVGIATPMLLLGSLMATSGLEAALTAFNDQMALLPLGLSRILGITVHLGIPTEIPFYVVALGSVLAVAGLVLGAARRPTPSV